MERFDLVSVVDIVFSLKPHKAKDWFKAAPILYVRDSYYVIGGNPGNPGEHSNIIGRLDPSRRWTNAGNLEQGRRAHNAIIDNLTSPDHSCPSRDCNYAPPSGHN